MKTVKKKLGWAIRGVAEHSEMRTIRFVVTTSRVGDLLLV